MLSPHVSLVFQVANPLSQGCSGSGFQSSGSAPMCGLRRILCHELRSKEVGGNCQFTSSQRLERSHFFVTYNVMTIELEMSSTS